MECLIAPEIVEIKLLDEENVQYVLKINSKNSAQKIKFNNRCST